MLPLIGQPFARCFYREYYIRSYRTRCILGLLGDRGCSFIIFYIFIFDILFRYNLDRNQYVLSSRNNYCFFRLHFQEVRIDFFLAQFISLTADIAGLNNAVQHIINRIYFINYNFFVYIKYALFTKLYILRFQ